MLSSASRAAHATTSSRVQRAAPRPQRAAAPRMHLQPLCATMASARRTLLAPAVEPAAGSRLGSSEGVSSHPLSFSSWKPQQQRLACVTRRPTSRPAEVTLHSGAPGPLDDGTAQAYMQSRTRSLKVATRQFLEAVARVWPAICALAMAAAYNIATTSESIAPPASAQREAAAPDAVHAVTAMALASAPDVAAAAAADDVAAAKAAEAAERAAKQRQENATTARSAENMAAVHRKIEAENLAADERLEVRVRCCIRSAMHTHARRERLPSCSAPHPCTQGCCRTHAPSPVRSPWHGRPAAARAPMSSCIGALLPCPPATPAHLPAPARSPSAAAMQADRVMQGLLPKGAKLVTTTSEYVAVLKACTASGAKVATFAGGLRTFGLLGPDISYMYEELTAMGVVVVFINGTFAVSRRDVPCPGLVDPSDPASAFKDIPVTKAISRLMERTQGTYDFPACFMNSVVLNDEGELAWPMRSWAQQDYVRGRLEDALDDEGIVRAVKYQLECEACVMAAHAVTGDART